MEQIRVRCRSCGKEMEGQPGRTVSCGCPNMTTIRKDKISAIDLTKVVMLNSSGKKEKSSIFSSEELAYQEARRKRKVRRIQFEER